MSGLLTIYSFAYAASSSNTDISQYGIQGSIATGGNFGIAVVHYTNNTELGLAGSGSVNNPNDDNKTFTVVFFAGLRKALGEQTYFAYGINTAGTFGRLDGENIQSDYAVGPYISLEQMLTPHLILTGWILPYQYQHEKTNDISTSTNRIFAAGGIGIAYLF